MPEETPSAQPTPSPTTDAPQKSAQGLAGLARMSTTAGAGLQEYRAINPWGVTSIVAGLASWLALLTLLLLVVPVIAILCGAVALVQVRRSHGTQSGGGLAVAGIVLGLVAGSYVTYSGIQDHRRQQASAAEIQQTVVHFGERLTASDHAGAYAMTDRRFQEAVPLATFRSVFDTFARKRLDDGRVVGITPTGASTNGRAVVTTDPATGVVTAEALLILRFPDDVTARQEIGLVRRPEGWRISHFGDWFGT